MSSPATAQLIHLTGDPEIFQQIIELENGNRSIGRGLNCDIVWSSLQISRRHATFECMESKWYIRDTSTNGLTVNGVQLVKGELFPLKDGDIISFVPTGSVRYRFRYTGPVSSLRGAAPANNVRRRQQRTRISPRPSTSREAIACSSSSSLNGNVVVTSDRTDSRPLIEVKGDGDGDRDGNDSDDRNHSESVLSLDPPDGYSSFHRDENTRSPSPILSEQASACSDLALTKRKKEVDSSDDSDNNTAIWKKKRCPFFSSSSSSDDEDNSNKSDSNGPVPSSSFKTLGLPKESSFISDEDELISKVKDPETLKILLEKFRTELKSAKNNLEKVECELAMARQHLEYLRQKELDARSVNTTLQEETYKKIVAVMDTELSCSICNEVFIQATVIDCGHTFCHFCINEWARKKTECPVCRKKFLNRSRHIEIENFINKSFESFSTEMQNKRKISIQEREEQAKKALEDAGAAATENQQRQAGGGGNFHAFIQTNEERYVNCLAELHPINETLAPGGTNGRRANATNNAERRSARIQDRVINAVVAGAAGAPARPLPAATARGRRAQRGRGRAAARVDASGHVPNIPVVTLDDTADDENALP